MTITWTDADGKQRTIELKQIDGTRETVTFDLPERGIVRSQFPPEPVVRVTLEFTGGGRTNNDADRSTRLGSWSRGRKRTKPAAKR